jgi:zinc protease
MLKIIIAGLFLMTSMAHANDQADRILDIQTYTTPKGIEVWHVADHSLPIITMNFAFRGAGAIQDPDGKIGLGQLLSNTLDEGAGARDANTYQEALQDHAIELSFNNSRDHFAGKIKTLKRHSDLAFELLYDAIHTPIFDDEALNRMRHANIMRIKSSVSKPNWMASRLMNDTYFGDHAYTRNSGGTVSDLKNITSDDLQNFVTQYFTRDRLVVGVAGDLSSDKMMAMVDRVFGDLPMSSEDVSDLERVQISPENKKIAYKLDSPQSVVQMIWSSSITKEDPDYYAYRVMNYMLGGGGFSSFLMEEIREKKGLTYGIYSSPVFMKYDDYIVIESATSPENIAPMIDAIQTVLTNMKTNLVTDEMLSDAKNYLIGVLPLRFATTQSLSGTALRMQLDGRDQGALDEWDDHIHKVTAEDVRHAANKIFESLDAKATVIVGAVPDELNFEIVDTIPGVE